MAVRRVIAEHFSLDEDFVNDDPQCIPLDLRQRLPACRWCSAVGEYCEEGVKMLFVAIMSGYRQEIFVL